MTTPLDLVTGGLGQASGLSLVTGGLLIVREITAISGSTLLVPPKVDVKLAFDVLTLDGDVSLQSGDLVAENSLQTALMLSLFTDRRASAEQLERFGGDQPRGWWGDADARVAGDEFGSLLWLLEREVQSAETLNRAREYAEQAVAWIIEDGIAQEIPVLAEFPRTNMLALQISPVRARGPRERFAFVWEL